MNQDLQVKLQAHFDGELPAGEAREVERLLAEDAGARALLDELRHTQSALAAFAADTKLPESREFYWSKIERAIARAEGPVPAAPPTSPFLAWRRFLVPASALAVLAVAALVASMNLGPTRVPAVESTLTDAGAFTYRDYASGTTLVWLSYPAENGVAKPGSDDILD